MKKIGIVTGASSGMGREFLLRLAEEHPKLEEIWAVARRKEQLELLQREVSGVRIRMFSLDLMEEESFQVIEKALKKEKPWVGVLVNSSGVGYSGLLEELSGKEVSDMVQLNCRALTMMTYLVLPYMKKGGQIYQLASSAAFAPQPGFAVYAASKAYVLRFAAALGQELRPRGIRVISVCPGPVKTEFLDKAYKGQKMPFYKRLFIADSRKVVSRAIRDAKKGKAVSVYGISMKFLRIISRLLPEEAAVRFLGT